MTTVREHNRQLERDAMLLRAAADILSALSTTYTCDPIYWVGWTHPQSTALYRLADELDGGE